jgi:UDP-N-acetylglucosamine--N-acetylmuramyl-(pentapeptide) pyrophosphoryl-undecaprenol N-acetylglucosamine transferase
LNLEPKIAYKILISGGGTGGHLFPALAIADYIRDNYPGSEIEFIGAKGRMEMEKVPASGYKITGLDISGINRKNPLKNIGLPFKVMNSVSEVNKVLKRLQPDVVIGVGGYSTGPVLLAALLKKIPTLIQEQNFYPGVTNRMLAKWVDKICVAFDGMEKYLPAEKLIVTGNPVRKNLLKLQNKEQNGNGRSVLVIGGSLGARTINETILAGLKELEKAEIKVLWQTGKFQYQEILKKTGNDLLWATRIVPFIDDMVTAYDEAGVVVSRAGAISLSELAIAGKPAILIPSPNVAEDHQTKNAQKLVDNSAAIMIPDSLAKSNLVAETINLVNDREKRAELSKNIKLMAKPDATKHIAEAAIELANKKKR